MIGVDMIFFPTQFLSAFEAGHDIAVHTWSHPYMTTLNDVDVVAQVSAPCLSRIESTAQVL